MAIHVRQEGAHGGVDEPISGESPPLVRPNLRTIRLFEIVVSLMAASASCGGTSPTSTVPTFDGEAEVRVLFVGNSLTYANDLPGMVATISAVAGASVSTATIAYPNYALQDHWASGLADRIRTSRPTVVVMQQGPSSLPESRANLVEWTDSVARVAREVGATPALLMVWPELARFYVFDAVRDSYHAAAEHVDGTFIPAGEAFRALRERHPEMDPYGTDGFHPSELGTVVSAFVVVRTLLGVRVTDLPSVLDAGGDTPRITLTDEEAHVLTSLADSVGDAWAATNPSPPLVVR